MFFFIVLMMCHIGCIFVRNVIVQRLVFRSDVHSATTKAYSRHIFLQDKISNEHNFPCVCQYVDVILFDFDFIVPTFGTKVTEYLCSG